MSRPKTSRGRIYLQSRDPQIGQRYGRLVLTAVAPRTTAKRYRAQCDCGTQVIVWWSGVREGRIVSCGCRRAERQG